MCGGSGDFSVLKRTVLLIIINYSLLLLLLLQQHEPTCVHWQNLVISEECCDKLYVFTQYISVERPRCQSEYSGLFLKGADDLGMTVTLVNRTVGAQEIKVAFAFHVPYKHSCKLNGISVLLFYYYYY